MKNVSPNYIDACTHVATNSANFYLVKVSKYILTYFITLLRIDVYKLLDNCYLIPLIVGYLRLIFVIILVLMYFSL